MAKYFVHVAFAEGDKQKVHGPFDSPVEAHNFGIPFAEEGLDVEVHSADGGMCDFCSDRDIAWSYSARDFGVVEPNVQWGSRGSWAACQPCHDFIEANDRKGLTERSVKNFYVAHPEMKEVPEDFLRKHVMLMHEVFFQVRIGGAKEGVEDL
jgi:hypothetical protein